MDEPPVISSRQDPTMMRRFLILLAGLNGVPAIACAQDTNLAGLWHSKRYFGPEVRGRLEVRQVGPRWQATIGSRVAPVRVYRDSVSFELPAAADFRGRIAAGNIVGHWIERADLVAQLSRSKMRCREHRSYADFPVFVREPGTEAEDAGVVLSVVLDANAGRSFLLVLDAGSFDELARAEAPHHIPFGFHGQFFR